MLLNQKYQLKIEAVFKISKPFLLNTQVSNSQYRNIVSNC